MWNTACTNRICFHQDKTNEQNMHLRRLYCIRPQVNTTEPYAPTFLKIRAPQIEKKRQTQALINKDNYILENKILDALRKNSKYSQQPKIEYPAFRRYSNLKYEDIIRLSNIALENIKFENKKSNLKATYEYEDMKKEAEKQKKYLKNLLNRPKSIPFTPALKFYSIEQIHNMLKKQLILQQQYLSVERSSTEGTSKKRGNSASQMRTNTNNNSRINKSTGENNKSGNKTNRSQSSKNRKSLKINPDSQIDNNNNETKSKNKKETTTKSNTAAKK